MVGTSIFDWARRVTDYIRYVKGLLESLRDTIRAYQAELLRMRGDEAALVEMWYEEELAKLRERYADLENTPEYQKALRLLRELYEEKLKRAEEAAAEEVALWAESAEAAAESAGSIGGSIRKGMIEPVREAIEWWRRLKDELSGPERRLTSERTGAGGKETPSIGPFLRDMESSWKRIIRRQAAAAEEVAGRFSEMMTRPIMEMRQVLDDYGIRAGVEVKKEVRLDSFFQIQTFDPETTRRWLRETLFPEWEKYLKLRGIEL